MGRAPCCDKVGLKKGRWMAEEDHILLKYIATHGEGSWRSLPKKAGLLRCGKSCRLRWINYLKADIKRGNISKEEEDTIIKLHLSLGNSKNAWPDPPEMGPTSQSEQKVLPEFAYYRYTTVSVT